MSARRAIVRCERPDEDACIGAMPRAEDVAIVDIAAAHAALTVVGPLADAVLRALDVEQEGVVLVVRKDPSCVELLVGRAQGPALWYRLLEVGESFDIACVGVEAAERLDVSDHLSGLRR